MFKKEKQHINTRLKELGFFEYEEDACIKYTLLNNNIYTIILRTINVNNLRCELTKKEVIGGMVFAGKVMTSCVISDWQRNRFDVIDGWIDNFLSIPEMKSIIRSIKIKKIKNHDNIL